MRSIQRAGGHGNDKRDPTSRNDGPPLEFELTAAVTVDLQPSTVLCSAVWTIGTLVPAR